MKCVKETKKGCSVGVDGLLYIKGGSHISKMEYCLPRIYDI
jgi:hypothetical protein